MDTTNTPSTLLIPDLQAGLEFLARLHLADQKRAEIEINGFLDALLKAPLTADAYLDLLEQSRVPLCFVEEELARHYVNKPLPLGYLEEGFFRQVIATWLKMAQSYALCIQLDSAAEDAEHPFRLAVMLHRCIYYTGMALTEYFRARREVPPELWLDLHGYYSAAEEWGVAILPVSDALDPLGRDTHCSAAYLDLLLSELARPYSLSIRDQSLVRRWANSWSPLVSLHRVETTETLPPFAIDLTQDAALISTAGCVQTQSLRILDTSRLAMQLSQVRQQLGQRISPSQIGLGEDCTAGQCKRLLEHLSSPWAQAQAPRKFRRHATSGIAKLCVGFEAMHFYVSNKEFAQPAKNHIYTHQEYESLFAFRHMVDPEQQLQVSQEQQQVRHEQLGLTPDLWEEIDQSANGFRLMRNSIGKRMEHGQLLAICPHNSERYLLAKITWLMQEHNGGLIAGVEALAGVPQAVAVRPLGTDVAHSEVFSRAFMLPAVPAVGSEQSLVLPQGWFRPGRHVEVQAGPAMHVQLQHVLDDGPDFEQVSFVVS